MTERAGTAPDRDPVRPVAARAGTTAGTEPAGTTEETP